MSYIFFIITSLFIIGTIGLKGDKRLIPVVFILLCYNSMIGYTKAVPMYQNGRLAVVFTLFLVILFHWGKYSFEKTKFPIKTGLIIMMVVSLMIGFHSQCIDTPLHMVTIPMQHFIMSYCIIYLFYCLTTQNTISTVKQTILICSILLFVVAIINYIQGSNPYIALLQDAFPGGNLDFAFKYLGKSRFRVNSMFLTPFDYGFVCIIINLYALLAFREKKVSTLIFSILFWTTLVGIFLCNTRTIFMAYIFSIFIFFILTMKNTKTMSYMLVILCVLLLSYYTIDIVRERVDQLIDTVMGRDTIEGSSMELRQLQFLGALSYLNEEPVLGHGYQYISLELGMAEGSRVDSDMYGYESVIYQLMIERGFVGIIAYLLLYGSIVVYFIKNLKKSNLYAAFGIAVFVAYFIFAVSTGELHSVPISMAFLGLAMKNVELSKLSKYGRIGYHN